MSLDSAVDLMTPGFPFYQVFQGVGYAPTILVTSEPILSDTYSWQFLGKAPATMPVHQVVHSLQQTLATGETWTPYMVQKELQIDGSCGKPRLAYEATLPLAFNTNVHLCQPPLDIEVPTTGFGQGRVQEVQGKETKKGTKQSYEKVA
eukprot:symbB.v1.2.014660.t1/scaffold1077.1/size139779/7